MTDFIPYIAPPGPVVEPPVHPETIVDVFWSDGDITHEHWAGRTNWAAEGDGPKIVAYSVVKEYVPPKTPREWWCVGQHMHDTLEKAEAFRDALIKDWPDNAPYWDIYRVREVL